jgi:heat shock protein HslJ
MRALLYALLLAVAGAGAVSCCSVCRGARVIPVSGTEWALIELNDRVVDRGDGERLTLTLGEDGRVAGMGDCNRFFGTYSFDADGRFSVSGLGSTRAMCPDRALEDDYFRALGAAASFRVDGDFLLLAGADGRLIASFRKNFKTGY